MGLMVGPNRLPNDSAPTPNAPASKVAKPLFMPLLKVAPNETHVKLKQLGIRIDAIKSTTKTKLVTLNQTEHLLQRL